MHPVICDQDRPPPPPPPRHSPPGGGERPPPASLQMMPARPLAQGHDNGGDDETDANQGENAAEKLGGVEQGEPVPADRRRLMRAGPNRMPRTAEQPSSRPRDGPARAPLDGRAPP